MSQGSIELNRMRFGNLTEISRTAEKNPAIIYGIVCVTAVITCMLHPKTSARNSKRLWLHHQNYCPQRKYLRRYRRPKIWYVYGDKKRGIERRKDQLAKQMWLRKRKGRTNSTPEIRRDMVLWCDSKKKPRNTTMLNLQGQRFWPSYSSRKHWKAYQLRISYMEMRLRLQKYSWNFCRLTYSGQTAYSAAAESGKSWLLLATTWPLLMEHA